MPKPPAVAVAVARRPVKVSLKLTTKPLRIAARAEATPAGLLSIGALVSGILLSSAVIVWTATRHLEPRPRG